MTRTKREHGVVSRYNAIFCREQAAQLVEREACTVCAKAPRSDLPLPGHWACWKFVQLAREIRMLGTKEAT